MFLQIQVLVYSLRSRLSLSLIVMTAVILQWTRIAVRWREAASVLAPLLPWCTGSGVCGRLGLQRQWDGCYTNCPARCTCGPKSCQPAVSYPCQLPRQDRCSNWTTGLILSVPVIYLDNVKLDRWFITFTVVGEQWLWLNKQTFSYNT